MPLRSYTLIHKKAMLSNSQRDTIITWVDKIKDSLQ